MTDKQNNQQNSVARKQLSAKEERDERLKKSLRANLQRRKAKMRAIKAADKATDADNPQ